MSVRKIYESFFKKAAMLRASVLKETNWKGLKPLPIVSLQIEEKEGVLYPYSFQSWAEDCCIHKCLLPPALCLSR